MQRETEDIIAAICCAILGAIGIFVNGSCILLIFKIKSLKTSFGYLTLYHSFSNGFLILSYLFWVAPCILFGVSNAFLLNRSVGQMTIIAQASSYFSMLLLSLNRFICVFLPTRYNNIFSNKSTFAYIFFFTSLSLTYGVVYFKETCYFIFDPDSLEFSFGATPCGDILAKYMDFWFSIFLFGIVYCVDVCTLVKLRLLMNSRTVHHNYGSVQRFRKEILLFVQTFCTTILFSFTVCCFHYISDHFTKRFDRFLCTTLIWGINHAGAGIIIAAFNREIRHNILRPIRPKSYSSGASVQLITNRVSTITRARRCERNI